MSGGALLLLISGKSRTWVAGGRSAVFSGISRTLDGFPVHSRAPRTIAAPKPRWPPGKRLPPHRSAWGPGRRWSVTQVQGHR